MERNWTYRDPSGTEYGPYTWQEIVRYAQESRIDPDSDLRCGEGGWQSPGEAGVFNEIPRDQGSVHPHRTSEAAISAANTAYRSPHNRRLYLLLGILLPLFSGIAGINNLIVGRIGTGLTQLMLSLFNFVLILLGFLIGITFCLALPLGTAIMIWSVLEAAVNKKDGQGLDMEFNSRRDEPRR